MDTNLNNVFYAHLLDFEPSAHGSEKREYTLFDIKELFKDTDNYLCVEDRGVFLSFQDVEYSLDTEVDIERAIQLLTAFENFKK